MKKKRKGPAAFYKQLARFGCMATAIVYVMIGVVAMLSLLRLKQGGADEGSILKFLEDVPFGKIVIAIILLGMVAFIIWRVYEAINDPYGYGRDWKGLTIRIITVLSAVSDALIGWPALESLLGESTALANGQPVAQRQMFAEMLTKDGGNWIVCTFGLITSVTAIVQFVYVIREAYEERIDMKRLNPFKQKLVHVFGYAGHFARGIILGLIGFFMLKAGLSDNAQYVVNTDKAFDFLGDNLGHLVFALVAIGTVCYGFFMFLMGYYYDFQKGKS